MRVCLTFMFCVLLMACNGVQQKASVDPGSQSTSQDDGISYSLTTITASNTVLDVGSSIIVTVNIVDANGSPYSSPIPPQVSFFSTGGSSKGNFSTPWESGFGSYSALFTGTESGTAIKIRALVNFRDVVTIYPQVTVQAPQLDWSPAGHEFGYISLGNPSDPIEFVLENTGNKSATGCGTPVLSDTINFSIVSHTCASPTLLAGGNCKVYILADPFGVGLKSATLSRTCSNTGTISTFSSRIRATGVQPVNLSWAPLAHTFPVTGVSRTSTPQTFTFTNTGSGPTINCEVPVISDTANFRITADTCQRTNLQAGASCTVSVAARPQSTGLKTAKLSRFCEHGGTVTTNDLAYTAVLPVSVAWAPMTFDFGELVSGDRTGSFKFTLTNSNNGTAVNCSPPVLSNATDFLITSDTCGTNDLGPLSSCMVTVQAKPEAAGTLTTTLSRTCEFDGTYSTTANGLTVTATAAEAKQEFRHETYNLGEVSPGKTSNVFNLVLRNTGTLPATGCSSAELDDTTNFSIISDTCGNDDLPAGGQCIVKVRATPDLGPLTARLERTCTIGGTASARVTATGSVASVVSLLEGVGTFHACALMDDGSVKCWGLNNLGQIGVSDITVPYPLPVTADLPQAAKHFSTNKLHNCAVLVDETVACWGNNTFGQLGNDTTETSATPVIVLNENDEPLSEIVKVSVGLNHSCALNKFNEVFCWGLNIAGQLGLGDTDNRLKATKVPSLSATIISAGNYHTCSLGGGVVKCWGDNTFGQLGDGTFLMKDVPTPLSPAITNAESIALGGNVSCLIRTGGVLYCWGQNGKGQLGDGSIENRNAPTEIVDAGLVSMVDTGGEHTCVIDENSFVTCWGANDKNQLGNNTYSVTGGPLAVLGTFNAIQVATGPSHTCALINDGSVKCWGDNSIGVLLGDDTIDYQEYPNKLVTLSNIVDVAQGPGFICAVDEGGSVFCWGVNDKGQLGNGTTVPKANPSPVIGITNARQIEAGEDSVCVLLADSSVSCWGANEFGSFGNNSMAPSLIPVATGLTNVTSLKMGLYGGCALLNDSTVKCWGMNQGDVGNGTITMVTTPALVKGIENATAIAKGHNHSCALLSDKTVKCWGLNEAGSLGTGTTVRTTEPTIPVKELSNVEKIESRGNTTCAILTDKTMKCWGANSLGQVGDGTSNDRHVAVNVKMADVAEVSVGTDLTCAVKTSGQMFCFGSYLGSIQTKPEPVYGILDVAIPSAYTDPCAINSAGDLYCWGSNENFRTNADINSVRNVSGF